MVKASASASSKADVDPKAEHAALRQKKLRVGMAVRAVTPNTHISRAGKVIKIEAGGEDDMPMVTLRGKTAAGKSRVWRNRPSLLEAAE